MVDGVERGVQIETDQDGDLLVISRRVNTVEDIQQCSLGRVTSSVRQLLLGEVYGETDGQTDGIAIASTALAKRRSVKTEPN